MIKDIKFAKIDPALVIDWLNSNKIFIKTNALGHEVTQVVGHLLHIHPKITHHIFLKDTLDDDLWHVKISPNEVIALDKSTHSHYQQAMDSGNEILPFIPTFELFPTELGSGSAENRVSTSAIGIKMKSVHHNLLCKLFSRLFTEPPADLAHIQYSLCGITTVISHSQYQALLHENNKFFSTLTTILVTGIEDSTLGLEPQGNCP